MQSLGVHMNNVNVHQGEVGEGTQLKEVFFARVLHFEQEAATFSLWEHLGILHLKRDCKPLPGLPTPSLRLESYQNLDSRKVWERVKANAYVQHA